MRVNATTKQVRSLSVPPSPLPATTAMPTHAACALAVAPAGERCRDHRVIAPILVQLQIARHGVKSAAGFPLREHHII